MGKNRRRKQNAKQRQEQEERRRRGDYIKPFVEALVKAARNALQNDPGVQEAKRTLKEAAGANRILFSAEFVVALDNVRVPEELVQGGKVTKKAFTEADADRLKKEFGIRLPEEDD